MSCATLAANSEDSFTPDDTAGKVDGVEVVMASTAFGLQEEIGPSVLTGLFEGPGFELYRGAEMTGLSDLDATPRPLDFGFFWPPEGSLEYQVTCFAEGNVASPSADRAELRTQAAAVLGSCPGGSPVEGGIEICSSRGGVCPADVSGDLDGHTLETTGAVVEHGGTLYEFQRAGAGQWLAWIYSAQGEWGSESGGGVSGVILTFPGSPQGPAVYCIGEGSEFNGGELIDGVLTITLTNLSKLGDCGGDDSLLACRTFNR